MNLKDLLNDPPKIHPFKGELIAWGLPLPTLEFLEASVKEGSRTLETGAGLSTILFALKGASHICITPFREEIERIQEYCDQHGISLQKVDFRVDLSTNVLPDLKDIELDLALIDGCHGFPTPFLDWYFTATKLKIGGTMVVDDVQIWTGRVLKDFLIAEPEWKLIEPFSDKTAIFAKQQVYHPWKEFEQQPYVVRQDLLFQKNGDDHESRFSKGLRLLRQGHILTLLRKMTNQLKADPEPAAPAKEEPRVVLPAAVENAAKTGEAVPLVARRAAEEAVRVRKRAAGKAD